MTNREEDEALDRVIERMRAGQRVLVSAHLFPDGDAIGSMLALGSILRSLGKEVTVYNPDPIPERYRFLPGWGSIVRALPPGATFDSTFVVDCGDAKLLGQSWPSPEVTGTLVVLDHHKSHTDFGDIVFRREACAVGEIVYRIATRLGMRIDPDCAECIYASMATDTGGFRYSSTTPAAMRIAANLIEAGVQPWKVAWHLFEGWPIGRLRLLVDVLGTLELSEGGRVATLRVSREVLSRNGASADMLEGFVNYARMLNGVEVAALLVEADDGTVRVSLRSIGRVPVDTVAAIFGGGGHMAAAGCTFLPPVRIDEALGRITAALASAAQAAPLVSDDGWSPR